MDKTKIDWADSTWSPVTGCLHGCEYCYARGIANRFASRRGCRLIEPKTHCITTSDGSCLYEMEEQAYFFNDKDFSRYNCAYPHGFTPTFHRYHLNDYMGKKGRNIFVCSMADLFGDWVPDSWIVEIINSCLKNPDNNYLFLTKNPQRYKEHYIPRNFATFWFGTTVTNKSEISRVLELAYHRNKFVSIEPLLEDLELKLSDSFFLCVDWVIVGAQTGNRKNKVIPRREWIENIVNLCREHNIPVFMKSSLADIWGEKLIQEFPLELMNGR